MTTAGKALAPKVLVAPLDWGLGHATRCIPIVRYLINNGAEVLLAGEGKIAALLKAEFPQLQLLPLPGYRVHYRYRSMPINMLLQMPKIYRAIRYEQQWVQQTIIAHNIRLVISDNRYGLHSSKAPCVFITHQLTIKTGMGSIVDKAVQKLHYRFIKKFAACWVPDAAVEGIAGELSHPQRLPALPLHYIGPVTRFKKNTGVEQEHRILILLSGPEPQRTLWEQALVPELKKYSGDAVLVRGLPGTAAHLEILPAHVKVHHHLPAAQLQQVIASAALVICRSGYSSVMDLLLLQKKTVLVPTPSQPEQEYLARYLQQKGWSATVPQKKFSLQTALQQAQLFGYQYPQFTSNNNLAAAVASVWPLLVKKNDGTAEQLYV